MEQIKTKRVCPTKASPRTYCRTYRCCVHCRRSSIASCTCTAHVWALLYSLSLAVRPHPAAGGRVADLRRHSAADTARIGRNSSRCSNPPPTGRSSGRRSPAPSPINALSPTARCSAMHSVRTAGERPPHLPIPRTGGTKSMALIRSGGPAASSCGGRRRSPAQRLGTGGATYRRNQVYRQGAYGDCTGTGTGRTAATTGAPRRPEELDVPAAEEATSSLH